ncbi:hypothetical protein [Paraburkholderia adhaesiva]|uniref:hypothetical protein n=1 Tax=Paraburkholderia adhaesiva TaxID=2883244 RepID=UPI001F3552DC|nr:hypothetical protein [Paraburkholderia adhaesiva]
METLKEDDINRLKDLMWVLTDIRIDITAAVYFFNRIVINGGLDKRDLVGPNRVCFHTIVLQMCRFREAWDHYGKSTRKFLPKELCKAANLIKICVEDRGYYRYRSSYLAHAISDKTKRPVLYKDAVPALKKIVGYVDGDDLREKMIAYCNWICSDDDDCVSQTIGACISEILKLTGPVEHRSKHV